MSMRRRRPPSRRFCAEAGFKWRRRFFVFVFPRRRGGGGGATEGAPGPDGLGGRRAGGGEGRVDGPERGRQRSHRPGRADQGGGGAHGRPVKELVGKARAATVGRSVDRSTTETEATRERKKKKKKKMERGGSKENRPEEKREWQEKAIAGVARMDKGSKVRQFKDDKQRPRQGRS